MKGFAIVKIVIGLSMTSLPYDNIMYAQDVDIRGEKARILIHGTTPDPIYLSAEQVVSKKWHIELYPVAGCSVSPKMQDSIHEFNHKTYELLKAKYGANWQVDFYKEIDTEYQKMLKVVEIMEADPKIVEIMKKHHDLYFTYQLYPVLGTNSYDVKINNIETFDDKTSSITYYLINVNTENLRVKVKNNTKKLNFHYE